MQYQTKGDIERYLLSAGPGTRKQLKRKLLSLTGHTATAYLPNIPLISAKDLAHFKHYPYHEIPYWE